MINAEELEREVARIVACVKGCEKLSDPLVIPEMVTVLLLVERELFELRLTGMNKESVLFKRVRDLNCSIVGMKRNGY